jgi:hypothetical protein
MVAMVASAAASLVRATPWGNGGVQGKRVMQGLMALQAAKLFVAVEAEGLRSRGAVATGASRARAGLVREEECEVGAFCPLYSSLREVSTRGVVARSASAVNGGECVLFLSSVAIGLAFSKFSLLVGSAIFYWMASAVRLFVCRRFGVHCLFEP